VAGMRSGHDQDADSFSDGYSRRRGAVNVQNQGRENEAQYQDSAVRGAGPNSILALASLAAFLSGVL